MRSAFGADLRALAFEPGLVSVVDAVELSVETVKASPSNRKRRSAHAAGDPGGAATASSTVDASAWANCRRSDLVCDCCSSAPGENAEAPKTRRRLGESAAECVRKALRFLDLVSRSAVPCACRGWTFTEEVWKRDVLRDCAEERITWRGSWRDTCLGDEGAGEDAGDDGDAGGSDVVWAGDARCGCLDEVGILVQALYQGSSHVRAVESGAYTAEAVRSLVRSGQPGVLKRWCPPETLQAWRLFKHCGKAVRCVAQSEPTDVFMTLTDFLSGYSRVNADADPLYVIDDEVSQDFDDSAYPQMPQLPPGPAQDFFADLALEAGQNPDLIDAEAHAALSRERRYVLFCPVGGGSRWHVDPCGTDAWNVLLTGRKLWALSPPSEKCPQGVSLTPRLQTSWATVWTTSPAAKAWFAQTLLPLLREAVLPEGGSEDQGTDASEDVLHGDASAIFVLDQKPGDVVYVPRGWWHATLCLEATAAVTQNVVGRQNARTVVHALRPANPRLADALQAHLERRHADG